MDTLMLVLGFQHTTTVTNQTIITPLMAPTQTMLLPTIQVGSASDTRISTAILQCRQLPIRVVQVELVEQQRLR